MKHAGAINILEMHTNMTDWLPPPVDEKAVAAQAAKELNITGRKSCFYIFRTEPYIDALFIRFDALIRRQFVKRFTFREGYVWDFNDEQFFMCTVSVPMPAFARQKKLMMYSRGIPRYIRNGIYAGIT